MPILVNSYMKTIAATHIGSNSEHELQLLSKMSKRGVRRLVGQTITQVIDESKPQEGIYHLVNGNGEKMVTVAPEFASHIPDTKRILEENIGETIVKCEKPFNSYLKNKGKNLTYDFRGIKYDIKGMYKSIFKPSPNERSFVENWHWLKFTVGKVFKDLIE